MESACAAAVCGVAATSRVAATREWGVRMPSSDDRGRMKSRRRTRCAAVLPGASKHLVHRQIRPLAYAPLRIRVHTPSHTLPYDDRPVDRWVRGAVYLLIEDDR